MLVSKRCTSSEWQVVARHIFPKNETGKHPFLLLHFLHHLNILDAMPVVLLPANGSRIQAPGLVEREGVRCVQQVHVVKVQKNS